MKISNSLKIPVEQKVRSKLILCGWLMLHFKKNVEIFVLRSNKVNQNGEGKWEYF